MILGLAKKAASRLANKGYIPLDDVDLIAYGFFAVLSKFIYGAICVISGLVFNRFVESIVFYISFLFIRKYAGGFHASSEIKCFIASTCSIICAIACIHLASEIQTFRYVMMFVSVLSTVLIVFYSPVASQENPLSVTETKKYARISIIRITCLILLLIVFCTFNFLNYSLSICGAIIIESILLLIGKK